jgi:hypothetical protein
MGDIRNAYRILVAKPKAKRPLIRGRRKWEDNRIMDVRELVWEGVDWMLLAQGGDQRRALVNTVMNIRIP